MNQNKKSILVTGGAGYIGTHMVKRLLKDGYDVVVFDNFSRGFREPLETLKKYGNLKLVEGDLQNLEDLKKISQGPKIDAVMHFAAFCLVDESVRKPEMYFNNNTLATENLLKVMETNGIKKIIFSSTCAVYGNSKYLPMDEKHPTNPTNPYGKSKVKAEEKIQEYSKLYGINFVILRYFNVCGADTEGEIGDSKRPSELLIQNAVRGALGIEDFKLTCPKVNTPDGTPIRDYIDVEDLVEAHISAYKYLEDGKQSTILNLGNGRGWSVKEIVDAVKKELHTEFIITEGQGRQGEYEQVYADIKKAKELLHFSPKKTLGESIQTLAKWYKKKPHGYES